MSKESEKLKEVVAGIADAIQTQAAKENLRDRKIAYVVAKAIVHFSYTCLVEQIAWWIKNNADKESIFKTADPQWEINVTALLDFISEATGISRKQISAFVDKAKKESKFAETKQRGPDS